MTERLPSLNKEKALEIKKVLDLSWCAIHPHKTRDVLWLRMREEFGYTQEVREMGWIRPMSSRDIYKRLKEQKRLSIL